MFVGSEKAEQNLKKKEKKEKKSLTQRKKDPRIMLLYVARR